MSSRRTRITEQTLKALKPAPAGTRTNIFDTLLPGFYVQVTDKGAGSFYVYTRFGGSRAPSRRKLGKVGAMSLAEARAAAREQLEAAHQGRDPKAEQRAERLAKEGRKTFGDLVEIFIARHVSKQRKARDVEREIRNEILPKFGDRPIEEISRREIAALIGEICDRPAPRHAHNIFGHLRRFYSWLLAQPEYEDLIPASPCDRLRAKDLIGEKKPRQRVLSDAELAAVWKASGKLKEPWRGFYRLLMLTGARKTEVSDAHRGEFDLAAKLWTVPPERFKSDATHIVPLSPAAIELIERMPRGESGDFVFTTTDGRIPIDGFSKSKARLDQLAEIELGEALKPWQVHDLRRSVRTRLASLRVPDAVAEMVLGHGKKGLQRVYDQHTYEPEMREALELWAGRLCDIVTPRSTDNVGDLESKKGARV